MKTNTTIFGKSASTIGGPRAMIAMNTNGTFEVANIDFSSTNKRSVMSAIRGDITSVKALDVVDAISVSGEGLPTEQAVANYIAANAGAKMSFQASKGTNITFSVPSNATHIIYSGIPFELTAGGVSYENVIIMFKFGPADYASPVVMIKNDGSVSSRTGLTMTRVTCTSGPGTGTENYIYQVTFEK